MVADSRSLPKDLEQQHLLVMENQTFLEEQENKVKLHDVCINS